jgi:transposase-like protein
MKGLSCPRCDSDRTAKVADSPVKGKWEAYRCGECFYVWRSTEDLTGIHKNVEYWKKTAVRFWD